MVASWARAKPRPLSHCPTNITLVHGGQQIRGAAPPPLDAIHSVLLHEIAPHCNGNNIVRSVSRMKRRLHPTEPPAFHTTQEQTARTRALLNELKNCKSLQRGKQIHAEAIETGNASSIHLSTALVRMYTKCGSMAEARQVFDHIKHPDVVSWTTLILGYVENGEEITALNLFERMKNQGCSPNSFTFVAALKAWASLGERSDRAKCLELGKKMHSEIGDQSDLYVASALINMYAKLGNMTNAREVFDGVREPNVVCWTTLILGYAENGEGIPALDMFESMRSQGCRPDSFAFVAALKALSSLAQDQAKRAECLRRGKELHSQIGCNLDFVQNTLIDMYSNCGSMKDARQVFDDMKQPDVVSWNALISGYVENGESPTALALFAEMPSRRCAPNAVTFVAALKACISLALDHGGGEKAEWLERGREIHSQIGRHWDIYVQNTLINLYAKCGSMVEAREVFDSVEHPSTVSWNALILGYTENGEAATALGLFTSMKAYGCAPSYLTMSATLKACGLVGALDCGTKIHSELDVEMKLSPILLNSLVDFYAKCGNLTEAQKVFDSHPGTRDLITWNALLGGYSRTGSSNTAFELFQGMQEAGLNPDGVTFLCILMCCRHAGLVEKGKACLEAMASKYGVAPGVEHYTCLIDLLGRSNKTDDAMALLQSMPCRPDAVTWMTVLAACLKWKNANVGWLAFGTLVVLDGSKAAAYVLMADLYRSLGMWKEQEMVLALGNELKDWKEPGETCWTNEEGRVHRFLD